MTKHISLYENFQLDDSFKQEIKQDSIIQMVNLFNEPNKGEDTELELHYVIVEFDLGFEYKRSGIEGVRFSLRRIGMNGEFVSFDGDYVDEFDIEDIDIPLEKYEKEIGGFPLYIEEVEIDMNNSMNPEDFKYNIKIGHFN